jgi:hypothetical protein
LGLSCPSLKIITIGFSLPETKEVSTAVIFQAKQLELYKSMLAIQSSGALLLD